MYLLKSILAGSEFTRLLLAVAVFAGILVIVYILYNELEKARIKTIIQSGRKRSGRPHRAFYESLVTALIIFITLMLLLATCGRI